MYAKFKPHYCELCILSVKYWLAKNKWLFSEIIFPKCKLVENRMQHLEKWSYKYIKRKPPKKDIHGFDYFMSFWSTIIYFAAKDRNVFVMYITALRG